MQLLNRPLSSGGEVLPNQLKLAKYLERLIYKECKCPLQLICRIYYSELRKHILHNITSVNLIYKFYVFDLIRCYVKQSERKRRSFFLIRLFY